MSIKIIRSGPLTIVTDMGRYGYQASGIQPTGAMDIKAAILANLLVGNSQQEALLEALFMGPEIELSADTIFAVTGGETEVFLDGKKVPQYQGIRASKGQKLRVPGGKGGMRFYIAFAGGIDVPVVLGSRSTDLKLKIGGLEGRKLLDGDSLPLGAPSEEAGDILAGKKLPYRIHPPKENMADVKNIRVVLGPQDEFFTEESLQVFQREIYTISNEADRMGYRLQGKAIEKAITRDLITDGIVFGSIQIPPNGQPIIMLADHQTTGGYPKIATVITRDLGILAQCRPGDKIKFEVVDVHKAQQLLKEQKQEIEAYAQAMKALPEPIGEEKSFIFKINNQSFDISIQEIKV